MRTEIADLTSYDPVSPGLEAALERFGPISLGDMNSVSLMRRIDTKYVLHAGRLPAVLESVADSYRILEIDGCRAMRYSSLYFDTPVCRFYHDHHKGKARRTKVRIRRYLESGIAFLEVKQKDVKGVTRKRRTRCAPRCEDLSADEQRFIDDTTARNWDLHPTIANRFRRLTLVDTGRGERITIDWDLSSCLGNVVHPHTNLVIIEVKQERVDRHAPVMEVLKSFGARPYRVSKYCLGMACLCPGLKINRFKRRLLHINKVTSETIN